MPRAVSTFLMFTGDAEEAMNMYVALFSSSRIAHIERYGAGEPGAEGSIKRADFAIGDQRFIAFDSPVKHEFTFTPSISIFVDCESDDELEESFRKLSEGGEVLMP